MGRFFRSEKSNHHFPELKRGQRAVSAMGKFFNWPKMSALLCVLSLGAGLAYLFQTNFVATKGYKIRELEEKISLLKEENKKLNLRSIELKSIASLSQVAAELGLVPAEKVELIKAADSSVALMR